MEISLRARTLRSPADQGEIPRAELVDESLVEFSVFDSGNAVRMIRRHAAVPPLQIELPFDPVNRMVQVARLFLAHTPQHLPQEAALDAIGVRLRAFFDGHSQLRLTPYEYQLVMAEDARPRNHSGDDAQGCCVNRVKVAHYAVPMFCAVVAQMHVTAPRIMRNQVAIKSLEFARLYYNIC
jgi:hypothetical protein